MKSRFILFRRAGVFYYEDTFLKKQLSLRTKVESEAMTLLAAKNESHRAPTLNRRVARTYLAATDPEAGKRTWQVPMDEMTKMKSGPTRIRHTRAMMDPAFDLIRNLPILETQAMQFLKVLRTGTVSTNVYLRRIQNFALDINWLPWPVLPKKQWPKVRFKEKREPVAVDELHRPQFIEDIADQSNVAVTPAAEATEQFVVGDGRRLAWCTGDACWRRRWPNHTWEPWIHGCGCIFTMK